MKLLKPDGTSVILIYKKDFGNESRFAEEMLKSGSGHTVRIANTDFADNFLLRENYLQNLRGLMSSIRKKS